MSMQNQDARKRSPGDEVAANLDERIERAKQQEERLRQPGAEPLPGTSHAEQTPEDQMGGDDSERPDAGTRP